MRQQTLWSPTCTAKQNKMPPTDTHMVDPSIDAPKKNPTNHLYRNVNTTMSQPVKPWSGSKMAQVAKQQSSREKRSHLMRFVPFGCVSCILNFHSAGTRCCLCLAGEMVTTARETESRWSRGATPTQLFHDMLTEQTAHSGWSHGWFYRKVGKKSIILLTELVEEEFRIEWIFPLFFHVQQEEKHGCSQGLRTRQCYRQWALKNKEHKAEIINNTKYCVLCIDVRKK